MKKAGGEAIRNGQYCCQLTLASQLIYIHCKKYFSSFSLKAVESHVQISPAFPAELMMNHNKTSCLWYRNKTWCLCVALYLSDISTGLLLGPRTCRDLGFRSHQLHNRLPRYQIQRLPSCVESLYTSSLHNGNVVLKHIMPYTICATCDIYGCCCYRLPAAERTGAIVVLCWKNAKPNKPFW